MIPIYIMYITPPRSSCNMLLANTFIPVIRWCWTRLIYRRCSLNCIWLDCFQWYSFNVNPHHSFWPVYKSTEAWYGIHNILQKYCLTFDASYRRSTWGFVRPSLFTCNVCILCTARFRRIVLRRVRRDARTTRNMSPQTQGYAAFSGVKWRDPATRQHK